MEAGLSVRTRRGEQCAQSAYALHHLLTQLIARIPL